MLTCVQSLALYSYPSKSWFQNFCIDQITVITKMRAVFNYVKSVIYSMRVCVHARVEGEVFKMEETRMDRTTEQRIWVPG